MDYILNINTHEDEEVTFIGHKLQKRQEFIMEAILANSRGYQIEDTVDGTVSEQVKNGLSCCSLVICDYGKVQELYETSATGR